MPTLKTRINLSMPEELCGSLAVLAKKDNMCVTTKALALLTDAILREEDALWTQYADERLKKKTKWVSHARMMKKYA